MSKRGNQGSQQENEVELPLGFGMALAQDLDAMDYFSHLSNEKKRSIVSFIQASSTGDEAKQRISQSVYDMKEHRDAF